MFDQNEVSNDEWTEIEFAGIELKDERLNKRCQEIAKALGKKPSAPINQACEDWADTKAAYRFVANKKVTPEEIIQPHCQRTMERMKAHELVLAVQDTTYFNYTHHPKTEGLGEIGNKSQKLRGFSMHSTLAVTPTGMPLGLLTQTFHTRPVGEPVNKPNELYKIPIEEKESYRWIEAFQKTLDVTPPGTEVVTVCDSEADIYEMFFMAQEQNAPLLVRATANRCLDDPEEIHKLWDKLELQPIVGEIDIHITGNQERKPRQATVSVRFAQVTLKSPWRPDPRKMPPVTMKAILVREENPPEGLDDPIEWLLLTNTSVNNFHDAVRVTGWYCCRWQIELYHKVIKSGCTVEDCRLKTSDRLQCYIAVMAVVAWRLHWLTYLNRFDPDLPCTVALNSFEWQALFMRIHRSTEFPDQPPTIHQAVRWIAQLGGFLARKSDGEPGITVIWRRWQRLQDMADTWHFANEQLLLMGNR